MNLNRYLLLIFIIISIFFVPFLLNPDLMTRKDNDLGRNYVPIFDFFRNSILTYHQIPLWRPDQLMGETFIGNPVSSLFYPANLIFIFFSSEPGSIIYLYIHILIAAFSTYYLSKSFSISNTAALAAALFYSFSTKILVHLEAGHITMVAALSLFPLAFLSIRKILIDYQPKWLGISSITLALIYFAYPTIFYYSFIFIGIYWIYWQFSIKKNSIIKILKSAGVFTTIFIAAVLLMSIELAPHLEFASLSTRSLLKIEDIALPLFNSKLLLSSLMFPYSQKNLDHETFLYLGFVPLVFSFIGFLYLPKFKKAILFFGMVFTFLFIAGLSTPVFPFLYKYAPLLSYSRITTRLWFIVALLVSLLAAYALHRINKRKIAIIAVALFLSETAFIFNQRLAKIPYLNFSNIALYQHMANDHDIFRVYCTTYCFNPQLLSEYSIQTLNGESPIQQTEIVNFLQQAGNYQWNRFAVIFPPYQVWQTTNPPIPNATLLGRANVKYIASTYPINNGDFIFLKKFENIFLYKNNQFMPRFYFENSPDSVNLARYSPNSINLKFERQKSAKTIVISENYYPGWVASVVNQKFKVELKDQIFKKVVVPSDTEDVWLKFHPKSYIMGETITLGTLIFLLLYLIKKRKINEKNRHT